MSTPLLWFRACVHSPSKGNIMSHIRTHSLPGLHYQLVFLLCITYYSPQQNICIYGSYGLRPHTNRVVATARSVIYIVLFCLTTLEQSHSIQICKQWLETNERFCLMGIVKSSDRYNVPPILAVSTACN